MGKKLYTDAFFDDYPEWQLYCASEHIEYEKGKHCPQLALFIETNVLLSHNGFTGNKHQEYYSSLTPYKKQNGKMAF